MFLFLYFAIILKCSSIRNFLRSKGNNGDPDKRLLINPSDSSHEFEYISHHPHAELNSHNLKSKTDCRGSLLSSVRSKFTRSGSKVDDDKRKKEEIPIERTETAKARKVSPSFFSKLKRSHKKKESSVNDRPLMVN